MTESNAGEHAAHAVERVVVVVGEDEEWSREQLLDELAAMHELLAAAQHAQQDHEAALRALLRAEQDPNVRLCPRCLGS